MTYSETKFREYIKKSFNNIDIWVHKLPDKKQTGSSAGKGLPDYVVISEEKTYWFEVKQVKHPKYIIHTFNLNHISDIQWITFTAMSNAGAEIYIAIYLNKELYIVPYKNLQIAKFIGGETSIHETVLAKWRKKWNPKNLAP